MKKILTASFFLVFLSSYAYAEYEDTEGYDENTEIRIRGEVTQILPRPRGPVVIVLHTSNRDYLVITAPQWFLSGEGFEIKVGASMKITGSKFIGREGNLYVIARLMKDESTGRFLRLRDSMMMPLWRGPHMKKGREFAP